MKRDRIYWIIHSLCVPQVLRLEQVSRVAMEPRRPRVPPPPNRPRGGGRAVDGRAEREIQPSPVGCENRACGRGLDCTAAPAGPNFAVGPDLTAGPGSTAILTCTTETSIPQGSHPTCVPFFSFPPTMCSVSNAHSGSCYQTWS